jgi:tRNA pseudouridine(55) synthase
MNGLINVLKPPGLTSHDVVVVLRRMFGKKRIGHTGTLDPGAAGVLPICVGQGTRVVEYIINKPKKYRAEFTFGIRTDTYDAGGKIVDRTPYARLEPSVVKDVLQSFKGEINQIPPMVSAVRYHGKRLYQLAREGKEIERKARCVQIYDIKLLRFQNDLEYPRLLCDLECSKGTYVRSICTQEGEIWSYDFSFLLWFAVFFKYLISCLFCCREVIILPFIDQFLQHAKLSSPIFCSPHRCPSFFVFGTYNFHPGHKTLNILLIIHQ